MTRRHTRMQELEQMLREAHRARPDHAITDAWKEQTMQRIRRQRLVPMPDWNLLQVQRFAWRFAACTGLTSLAALCYVVFSWGGPEQFLWQLTMINFDILPMLTMLGGLAS